MYFKGFSLLALAAASFVSAAPTNDDDRRGGYGGGNGGSDDPVVNTTNCNGKTYVYNKLAGYGYLPGSGRDKFGDTLGGIGSSIALEESSWKKIGKTYYGIIWALPDRGWNTEGTLNYQPRVHKFLASFTPNDDASVAKPAAANLDLKYLDTIKFYGPDGKPTTGLDPDVSGHLSYQGFPDLPAATYTGDGFGGDGPGGKRISIDSEGLVLNDDGTFWVSDEYGAYVYRFNAWGQMVQAIRPPPAFIPSRNGTDSFNAASPPRYDPKRATYPANPVQGRSNNQGFEGLSASPDGKKLYVLTQSALMQEGGGANTDRRYARFLVYDISNKGFFGWWAPDPKLVSEYVVPLPTYQNVNDKKRIAAQSEVKYISETQFLILSRDSNSGHGGADGSLSRYRQTDVFDISKATNINSDTYNKFNASIASYTGVLKSEVTAATYCPWIDFNLNSELNKFYNVNATTKTKFPVHNGGNQDSGLLNEKWEGLILAPINGKGDDGKYFLFAFSDNDFITQDGAMNSGQLKYADESGYDLDNQALVFQVTLPKGSKPRW